ncbi:MAG: MXAN_6640 family putative metalloprotease [Candidatus Kapaibacterium sp.]
MKKYLLLLLIMFSYSNASSHKCYYPEALDNLHNGKINKVMTEVISREEMQHILITEDSHFAIHYNVTGFNAVDNKDANTNGIPDYIDSVAYYAELAYQKEVVELGFPFSEIDSMSSGTPMYDIFIKELKNTPYYGAMQPETSSFPNNPNFRTSFMVLENDYAEVPKFRTTGIDGLKITIFHEFHHAIQYYMTDNNARVLAEMTSTFMEYRFFPEILDYMQWVKNWFESPMDMSLTNEESADAGYAMAIFFQYTHRKHGDGIQLALWKELTKYRNPVDALNNALISKSSNLQDAFCEFSTWMYYTGDYSSSNDYFLHSTELPEITFTDDVKFNQNELEITAELIPFTFSPTRVLVQSNDKSTNDTIIVILTNTDLDNARKGQSLRKKATYTLSKNQLSSSQPLSKLSLYFIDDSDTNYCNSALEFEGEKGLRYADAYPNPYRLNINESLHIPAPEKSSVYDKINLEIYTTDMKVVFTGLKKVAVHKGQLVLNLEDNELSGFGDGVYIFKAYNDVDSKIGKFMVKK